MSFTESPSSPWKPSPEENLNEDSGISQKGRSLWGKAQTKTRNSIKVSQSFRTLRDMMGDSVIEPKSLTRIRRLGQGAFAVVDECSYKPEPGSAHTRAVAVKRLKPNVFQSELDLNDFIREALLLKKLHHPNVVNVIGLGTDIERAQTQKNITYEHIFIVSEFMNEGTLYSKIIKQMKTPQMVYTVDQGLRWLIQIAKALRYLHNSNPRVIHRDLKIENVMLSNIVPGADGATVAKLGDFGLHALVPPKSETVPQQGSKKAVRKVTRCFLSRARSIKNGIIISGQGSNYQVDEVFRLSGRTGSLMYMAPEVLRSENYNEKADVYSFAIVLYEVLQKCILLAFISVRGAPAEVDQYIQSVLEGFRPYIPNYWPNELRDLLSRCWADGIADRPSMDVVVDELQKILDSQTLIEEEVDSPACMCCASQ